MILQKLRELADRSTEDLAPSMYAETPIRWFVDLDGEGRLVGTGFVETAGDTPRGLRRFAPHAQRSSGIRPKLLADNAEYALGVARDKSKPERVAACHESFKGLVARCAEETRDPAVEAVRRFLDELDRDDLMLPEGFDPADSLTFRVGATLPIDLPAVRRWWAEAAAPSDATTDPEMECLVCGETKPVERRQQFKIKGIPGGQPSGMALVSANAGAFESYGLEASLVSPICRACGEAFAKAANRLLRERRSHLAAGSTVFVFWTRDEEGFSAFDYLSQPEGEQVRSLLSTPWTAAKTAVDLDASPFYAAALTASGGRVVIRDWIDTTVPRARENLARFFRAQELVDPDRPDDPRWYGIYQLGGAAVREAKDLRPDLSTPLVSFALDGTPLPVRLLYDAVRRSRADQQVTRPRVALMKLVLASHDHRLEERMKALDLDNHDPAYLCGRLFAVLEDVQRTAIPGAKATMVDRFFGSASSAPASVFGTLLRNAQPHLGKIRKEKTSAYHALEERLEQVTRNLPTFPRTLNMRQQALFSLGYYHQRAQRRVDIAAATKAKESGETAEV